MFLLTFQILFYSGQGGNRWSDEDAFMVGKEVTVGYREFYGGEGGMVGFRDS